MKTIRQSKTLHFLNATSLIGLLLVGCNKAPEAAASATAASVPPAAASPQAAAAPQGKKETVQLMHVHGLSYSPDGSNILIPSHHGLAVFDGSSWSKAPGPQHDYMGFSATKDAIYSSGHPAPDAGLVNPFGVIKSTDGGQTWQKLGFEGESDFHLLTTGYETNAIYVVNSHPNSKMKQEGIYSTLNGGFSWEKAKAQGLKGNPATIATHPSNAKMVAAGTDNGLYLSQDGGDTFANIGDGRIVAAFFDLSGKELWYSTVDAQSRLNRIALDNKQKRAIDLPPMKKDAVAYIAQNPVRRNEYAIATFQRSVYLTQDEGKTWKQIADNGAAQ